jgi:tRNA(adenine34) deaminase
LFVRRIGYNVFMTETDELLMREALKAAETAHDLGEVPIGAILTNEAGAILAIAGNRTITDSDPTAHAEILVLREAARKIGNYRLTGAAVYTTIEPCAMCAGALVNARIKRLVFGAHDLRFGAVETVFRICDNRSLNHRIEITSGVLAVESRALMQDFFRRKREKLKIKNEKLEIF